MVCGPSESQHHLVTFPTGLRVARKKSKNCNKGKTEKRRKIAISSKKTKIRHFWNPRSLNYQKTIFKISSNRPLCFCNFRGKVADKKSASQLLQVI